MLHETCSLIVLGCFHPLESHHKNFCVKNHHSIYIQGQLDLLAPDLALLAQYDLFVNREFAKSGQNLQKKSAENGDFAQEIRVFLRFSVFPQFSRFSAPLWFP